MEKYKERAKDLLEKSLKWIEGNYDMSEDETNSVIKAMCQLAEEVEYNTNERWVNSMKNGLYTKEQVEELLQKQRELCAENARAIPGHGIRYCDKVSKDSILNAKLKLE